MKNCPSCKAGKPSTEFYKSSGSKDGLSGYCKECVKAYGKKRVIASKVSVKSKSCTECNRSLPIGEFYKNARAKDGHGTWCKACWLIFDRERMKNPEVRAKARVRGKRSYRKNFVKRIAWTQTPNGRFNSYRNDAKQRGLEFSLTKDEFMLFWQKPCYYCANEIGTIGLDRMDNSKGYVLGNIASCCSVCNFAKHRLELKEFVNHCEKVAANFAARKLKTEGDLYARVS